MQEWFHWAPSPAGVFCCSLALLFWWVGKSEVVFPNLAATHDEKGAFLWTEQVGLIKTFESHHEVLCPEMVSRAGYGAEPGPSTSTSVVLCPSAIAQPMSLGSCVLSPS